MAKKLNLMLVNRHGSSVFDVRLVLSGASARGWAVAPQANVECFELHHPDIAAVNTWQEKYKVQLKQSVLKPDDFKTVTMAAGSFRLLRFELVAQ